jgi:hypothetical protein
LIKQNKHWNLRIRFAHYLRLYYKELGHNYVTNIAGKLEPSLTVAGNRNKQRNIFTKEEKKYPFWFNKII